MSLLVTMPGRFGDILWSLPTVRALSVRASEPVDLAIAGEFASILPLLNLQPYIRRAFALDQWSLTPPEEWRAPIGDLKGTDWDEQRDLGYRGWPSTPLPYFIGEQMGVSREELQLDVPWITVNDPAPPTEIAVGFTEAWFELKLGVVLSALERQPHPYLILTPVGSRWMTEARYVSRISSSWVEMAGIIRNSDLFFGDCSALHVLAVALGKPVLLCEPMEARWNPIFYPFGMDGRVQVVLGNDGRPTFDARAVQQAIEEKLREGAVR